MCPRCAIYFSERLYVLREPELAYFGRDDKPVKNADGYAGFTAWYDNCNNWIEQALFDKSGRPTRHRDGYTKVTRTFDEAGRPVGKTYWGSDGHDGFTGMVATLSEKDLQVEYTCFDAADKPVRHKGGYTRKVKIYDNQGKLVDARYFDGGPAAVQAVLTGVNADGPAAKLGLVEGDLLLQYDGQDAGNWVRLIARREAEKPGDSPRELVVRRGDRVLKFRVSQGLLGVMLDDRVIPEEKGRIAAKAEPGKPEGDKVQASAAPGGTVPRRGD